MGDAMFSNPLGAMAGTKNWSVKASEYKAGAAVVPGTLVSFQTDGSVITATTSVVTALVCGVAQETKAATQLVNVVHLGLTYVLCDAGVTAGTVLERSTAVAGNVMAAVAQTGTGIGGAGVVGVAVQAVGADKAGQVLAFIIPSFLKTA